MHGLMTNGLATGWSTLGAVQGLGPEDDVAQGLREVQRDLELDATVSQRVAEQVLRLGDAVDDRVVVNTESSRRGPVVGTLLEVHPQRGDQAAALVVWDGEGAEVRPHEAAAGVEVSCAQCCQLDGGVAGHRAQRALGELCDPGRFEGLSMASTKPGEAPARPTNAGACVPAHGRGDVGLGADRNPHPRTAIVDRYRRR